MIESRNDFHNFTVGTETTQGTVSHIVGQADDHIIFQNEDGAMKILTTRTDDVSRAALFQSTSLSTEGGHKFQGVYQETLDKIFGLCMAAAMKKDVKLENVPRLFDPARDFIKNTKPIKKLLGSGTLYKHRVFINDEGKLGWVCGITPDEHLANQLNKLYRLNHIINFQIFRWFRSGITAAMGSATLGLFSTTDHKERESIVEEATVHGTRMVKEYHHAWYFVILIVIGIAIGLIAYYPVGEQVPFEWKLVMIGGIAGSIISSLQRTKMVSFDLTQSRTNVTVQAISRILIGVASGLLVMAASKSGIAFSMIENNEYAAILVAFAAGFSERFIPDILKGLMSDKDVKK